MIPLINKPNVHGSDSEYPYGDVRDQTMSLAGTPLNAETHGDIHQFFEKMMDESNIVANDLRDNEYNGWQLWEALQYACKNQRNYSRYYIKTTQTGTSAPTLVFQAENDLAVSPTMSYQAVGDYKITFPAGTFPDGTKVFIKTSTPDAGASFHCRLSGDSALRLRTYNSAGVAANDILGLSDLYIEVYP